MLQYTSLHNHTTLSLYDALGYPADYYKYVIDNGGDSMAITEHGNCNSLGYAVTAANALKSKGVKFRPIYGVEAYVLPSIEDWKKAHEDRDTANELAFENEAESKSKYYDPIKRRHHLVITALNNKGLQNLFTLVSLSYREGSFYRFPRMDWQMLRQYNDGLAISTACLAGLPTWCSLKKEDASLDDVMAEYDRELLPLLEIFGRDRAFLELQFNALPAQTLVNNHLIEYAKRTNYKLIVASDAHYCRPDLWQERELYKALGRQQMNKPGQDFIANIPKNIEDLECELYPHSAEQIWGAYERYFQPNNKGNDGLIKDAINRTHDIAWQLMSHVQPDSTIKLPPYTPTPEAPTPFRKLAKLCADRLKQKGLDKHPEYVERTKYELKIILDKNIAEYFLTKKAILDALRKKLLLGVGRGSGAGSIVNYLLDITLADPIHGKLLFERFISPSRAELPDIDSDCEDKDTAYELLKNEFGKDNVLAISNYNTLKLKSLVKDIAKLNNVPFEVVNEVTKVMESEARDAIMEEIGNDQKLYELTYERALKHSPSFASFIEQYPDVARGLSTLYKSVKSIGRHAGGVLIVPEAHTHLPIIRVRNVLQSPFTEGLTAQHLKLFGLIKFDVLGLSTLRIIRRCIELILKKHFLVIEPTTEDVWWFYNEHLHPDVINPADADVFRKVYQGGRFPSIFQFAETKVQDFCKRAKPKHLKDIAAITALWRPGPLGGQADQKYLAASKGKIKYEHPILEEVLADSRGVLIYQEQFMLLAHKLAGFSLDEADKLRKLLVKPSAELGQEMRQQRIDVGKRFVSGCMEKGMSAKQANQQWSDILAFISYGFNRSHSWVYAYNSYQCAWLYTHYEAEWIKACLEKDPDPDRTIATVTQLGYQVVKPEINESLADEWQIIDNRCIAPLTAIKGIGMAAAQELVAKRTRPFESIDDFFYDKDDEGYNKWRWSKFNKKAIDALITLEAFDSLGCVGEDAVFKNYAHMRKVVSDNFDKIKKGITREGRGKKSQKFNNDLVHMTQGDIPEAWTNGDRIILQRELMGTFDKSLLFTPKQIQFIDRYSFKPHTELSEEITPVWFFVLDIQTKMSARGNSYLKLVISDGQGNNRNVNYFRELPDVQRGQLHVAKMFQKEWFTNVEGQIHCIQ